jgi:serine/threonine protein kinase
LALAVAGVSLVPSLRYVRTLFRVVGEDQDPRAAELRYGQRIDAYRAALENSFARGTIAEDETFLSALRERLGISEAEDHLLRHYAKNVLFVAKAGDIVARFEKLRLLGEGGGGRTWLARDRIRERLVVLKEPLRGRRNDERAREAFLREGRLAAKVRHPNVVRVEEALEENGLLVLVLEYVDGGTLDDLLATRGQLPWRQAVSVAEEILAGLSAIHAVGILHRDVKPSNVLLTEEGTAKIADFGIAIQPDLTKTIQDPTRRMAGTPSYMAPEVLEGAFPTVASDIYGAAATLHAGLFGIPPQGGRLPAFPADAPPQLGAVLARALSADPRMRPPSARVFADELARACGRPLPHRVIVRP